MTSLQVLPAAIRQTQVHSQEHGFIQGQRQWACKDFSRADINFFKLGLKLVQPGVYHFKAIALPTMDSLLRFKMKVPIGAS